VAALALLLPFPFAAHAELPGITRGLAPNERLSLVAVLGAYRHGHDAEITSVRYFPDGHGLVTGSTDLTVRVWDERGDPAAMAAVGRGRVHALAVTSDGSRVAAAGAQLVISVFDARTGATQARLTGHTNNVVALAFSPEGKRLVSGGRDQTLRVWDVATGKTVSQIETRTPPIAAAFSIDGGLVLALLGDGAMLRWDLSTNEVTVGEARAVKLDAGAFSTDRGLVIAAGQRKLWVVDTGTGALEVAASGAGDMTSVAVAADGSLAATGDHDGRLVGWNLATRTRLFTVRAHPTEITAVDVSPDGKRVVTGSRDTSFREWDARSGKPASRAAGHESPAYAALELSSGEIVTAGGDGSVRLWDRKTGDAGATFTATGARGGQFAIAETTQPSRLVSGGDDGRLRIWTPARPTPLHTLAGNPGGIHALAVRGARLVTAGEDGKLRAFDLGRLAEIRTVDVGRRRPLRAVALAPDGRKAAAAGDDGLVYRVDLDSGQVTPTGDGTHGPILALAFSPDGTKLAVGADDGSVLVDGKAVARHPDAVRALTFCPAGDCLVSGSRDGRLRVGNTEVDLAPTRDAPRALGFARDGHLMVATQRGVVLLFRVR
jgi:WD40 repeat protein